MSFWNDEIGEFNGKKRILKMNYSNIQKGFVCSSVFRNHWSKTKPSFILSPK